MRDRAYRDAIDLRVVDNVLAGLSNANVEDVREFLRQRNRRVRPNQLRKYAEVFAWVDVATQGTPWRELTPKQAPHAKTILMTGHPDAVVDLQEDAGAPPNKVFLKPLATQPFVESVRSLLADAGSLTTD